MTSPYLIHAAKRCELPLHVSFNGCNFRIHDGASSAVTPDPVKALHVYMRLLREAVEKQRNEGISA